MDLERREGAEEKCSPKKVSIFGKKKGAWKEESEDPGWRRDL